MWFPPKQRSVFQSLAATIRQSWKRTRREKRLARRRSGCRTHLSASDLRGVQLLEPRTLLSSDFGDAPLPYPATLAENGAEHTDTGPMLGAARDSEADGVHSANASADDLTGVPDDEDGVTFSTMQAGGLGASAFVVVAGVTTTGYVDAWIDFNADGNWGGPDEQVAASVAVVDGVNKITFDVPSDAKAGTTFARFRLSTDGNLGPKGLAPDGEVEDYAVTIIAPAEASLVFGGQNSVTTGATGAQSVFAADIDGDGDMDFLSASDTNDTIARYDHIDTDRDLGDAPAPYPTALAENGARHDPVGPTLGANRDSETDATHSANADFDDLNGTTPDDEDGVTFGTMQVGALGATVTVNVQGGPGRLDAWIDFNGDGSWGGPGEQIAASIAVVNGDNTIKFDVPSDAKDGVTFARFRLSTAGNLSPTGVAVDGEVEDYAVTVLTPRAASGVFTAQKTVTAGADGAQSVFAADIDGDGDMDILSASYFDDKIAWYENDGNQNFTEHAVTTTADGAYSAIAADVDGDGDIDILTASYADNTIAWYENNGSQNFTQHTISTSAEGAHNVFVADVDGDGDGDVDMVVASRNDDRISWYENDGTQTFTPHTISTAADGAYSAVAADLDGDGDLDVLSASQNDDRIAWYENLGFDFGDAPAPYPTTLAENGARHTDIGPTLGTRRDTEVDSAHSANADSDNITGIFPSDEDGVTFGTIQVGALGASATVTVTGITTTGFLDAWIDFNGDGNWGGPGEQIAASVAMVNGANLITFDVPANAVDGMSFARLRLSTAGNLGVTGAARDGEVEDYAVMIIPPTAAGGVFSGQSTVTSGAISAAGVFAADVDGDGDGDMDMLSTSFGDNTIAWYENNGSQVFTAHTVTTSASGATSVFAVDVDGDGDMDILSSSYLDNTIAWYENNGSQIFTPHSISTTSSGAVSVTAADVDGDGDMDVLGASSLDDTIAWYENDGNQVFTSHTISSVADGASSVTTADADGDGDLDVVSASFMDNRITWYENNGNQTFTAHLVSSAALGARSVFAADVDGDGDTDLLSASPNDDRIAWYENDGNQNFTTHGIAATADGASSVRAADVDGDSDMDVLSSSRYENRIAWYENDGNQNFTTHTITTAAGGALSVAVADVDKDGDLDVLSASISDNKIAWYENLGSDYGDAPAPYPTTLAENGPRHDPIGPTLGANRDIDDAKGTHSANADADDLTGVPDDEDGVTFGTIQIGALGATVTVNVANAPTGAFVDAWIDFNGDGNWGGAGEHIAAGVAVVNGDNTIMFDVPADALDGRTFARFRLSSAGNLGVRGDAADGEVEDYAVTLLPSAASAGIFGGQVSVTTSADNAQSVFAADLDGDGDMDLLSASRNDDTIAWYENDGSQSFTARTISSTADGASSVAVADIDGDGDLDVLSSSSLDSRITWYENDGNETFTAHTISLTAVGAFSVTAADVDGDGDMDVLSASRSDNRIVWYENDGSQNFTAHTITAAAAGAASVFAADVDRDGDLDVLSASSLDNTIAWYENDGKQNFTPHAISASANGAYSVYAADVDGDGDTDVLSANSVDDTIVWYENDGVQNFTPHTITAAANDARSVTVADINGDGHLDVLSAAAFDGQVAWYENNGSQVFTTHIITSAAPGARSVVAADIDGDGDLDVASASGNDDRIAWYTNIVAPVLLVTSNINYAEDDPAKAINTGITVADADSATLATATVTITNAVVSEDVLSFTNDGATMGNIAIDTNAGGVLTLKSAGATATKSEWQAALRAVKYSNSNSANPDTTQRLVSFVVNDGDLDSNTLVGTTITITRVNDAPVLVPAGLTISVAEDSGVPIGAVGSLISAFTGSITDVDFGAVNGIAVIATDETNGVWYYSTNSGVNWTMVGAVDPASSLLLAENGTTRLYFAPAANYSGTYSSALTLRAWDRTSGTAGTKIATTPNGGITPFSSATDTVSVIVSGAPDTPSVTNATTSEDVQTTNGLVISRNAADGSEVTHFKITGIVNGTLFQNDGTTQISSGDFITFAQANAGLKFTPTADVFGTGSFNVQSSLSNNDAGLGGGLATATITISPVADTPAVTSATTNEDVQSAGGLVISRNTVDGAEITHFRISGISNGTLFQNDGTTPISAGSFITFAQASAGLKFTPVANLFSPATTFSFELQGSTSSVDAGLGGGVVTAMITVNPVADTPSVTNATTNNDIQTASGLVISRNVADGAEVTYFKITSIVNGTLFRNDGITPIPAGSFITFAQANAGLKFTPAPGFIGMGSFQAQASLSNSDAGLGGSLVTATITVNSGPKTPGVTNATTNEDVQTTSGLVISRNAADGPEVTHFKITRILNGTLFQNDGTTPISSDSFITFAQANAGLKFTPAANLFSPATPFSFDVQSSTSNTDAGRGGAVATATITVRAVADTPAVSNSTTPEDVRTTSGLVISRNAADGAEVTHFKITAVANGTLFQNDGITPINSGSFITYAQAHAGLKFTPAANYFGTGSFKVQASTGSSDAGLGGNPVTATITVTPVADTPSVTNTVTDEDTQTTNGLVISRSPFDGVEVTHFRITNIVNGTLFLNDGTTPINSGSFITFVQANAGLKFTPAPNLFGTGTFVVQASTSSSNAGLGGGVTTASITINPIADTPTVTNATTKVNLQTTSGLVISPNVADVESVTHFKITNIVNGTLFQNNGTTLITAGSFITVAQANAGLKFTPAPGYFGTGTFQIQASTSNSGTGPGGNIITATITVNAIAHTPSVTDAATLANTLTASGLVISRNAADGAEVTHFKITGITGGTLYQNNGTTVISNNQFITFAEGNAGLKFRPGLNSLSTGHFTVQAAVNNNDAGLGGNTVTASITVTLPPPFITGPPAVTPLQRPTILWTTVSGADRYQIWIGNQTTGVNPFLQSTQTTTSFIPSGDLGIGLYNLWIRSGNAAGQFSVYTPQYNFRINTATAFDPLERYQTTATPILSWAPLTGATKYDLWINNVSTGQQQVVRQASLTATSWQSPSDLTMGSYRAWVRGLDASGVAAQWSTAVEFLVLPTVSVIGPVNPTFDRTPTFSWNAVAGAAGYDLVLRDANTGAVVSNPKNIVGTSYTQPADLPAGVYRWSVYAVSSAAQRSQSATTQEIFIGGRPTLLTPAGNTSDTTPTFSWTPVDGAATYDLFVSRTDVAAGGIINLTALTSTSYTLSTPLPVGTYRVWVRAVNTSAAISPWSLQVDFAITAVDADTAVSNDELPLTGLKKFAANDLRTQLTSLSPEDAGMAVQSDGAVSPTTPVAAAESGMAGSNQTSPSAGLQNRTLPSESDAESSGGPVDTILIQSVMVELSTTGFLLGL